jgi:hypothetical protein
MKDILGDYLPVVLEGDAVFLSMLVVGGIVVVNIRARSLTDKPRYQWIECIILETNK